jgi:uncharacterized repeat protein (TIGR02543 family)
LKLIRIFSIGAILFINLITPFHDASAFSQFRTVTFYENAFSGDSVTATQTSNMTTNLTSFSSLNPAFSNLGSTFYAWNTRADGTGTSYSNSQSYAFTATLSLYAIWHRQYHTATFHENASAIDANSCTQSSNATVGLIQFGSLCQQFSKTGYQFSSWNTSPSGTGLGYADGDAYSFLANIDLYAIWVPIPTVTVSFDTNGAPQSGYSVSQYQGSSFSIPNGSQLSLEGFTFAGWNSQQNGLGTTYFAGTSYIFNSNLTLWAVWVGNFYSVRFLNTDGTTLVNPETYQVGGSPLNLPFPSRTGYTFLGWFSGGSSGTEVGIGGGSFSPVSDTSLYAQWSVNKFVISLNPAGGSVYRQTMTYVYGGPSVQLPVPSKSGFIFDGWYLASDPSIFVGSGNSYLIPSSSQSLVAKWTALPSFTISYDANGGKTTVLPSITNSGDAFRLPTIATTSNSGKVLLGWSTSPNSPLPEFTPDQVVYPSSATVYFAVWGFGIPWQIFGNVGIYARQKYNLTNAMKIEVRSFAKYIKQHRLTSVRVLGYSQFSGNSVLDYGLSGKRAHQVAKYLSETLKRLKYSIASISELAQGSLSTNTSVLFSTVEMVVN